MKKKYKIHFTLSWSTVACLALLLLACKSCSPARSADSHVRRTAASLLDSGCVPARRDQPQHVARDLYVGTAFALAAAGPADTAAARIQCARVNRKS